MYEPKCVRNLSERLYNVHERRCPTQKVRIVTLNAKEGARVNHEDDVTLLNPL